MYANGLFTSMKPLFLRFILLFCVAIVPGFAQEPTPGASSTPFTPATPPDQAASPVSSPSPASGSPGISIPSPSPAVEATPPTSAGTPGEEQKVARAEPAGAQEILTRLQIFLDQQNFCPGKIDGRGGEFTTKGLIHYQRSHGLPETGKVDASIPLDSVYPIYTTYALTAADMKSVGRVPAKPSEQAKLKYMAYRSVVEFLEERFHSDPNFLRKLNPKVKMDSLKVGDVVRVPNVAPFKLEDLREIGHMPDRPEFLNRTVLVSPKEKMLDVYDDKKLIAAFPITPGSTHLPAPPGVWMVVGIAELPWFRWDEMMLNHGQRSANFFNIPAGPRNPVGVIWIGLDRRGIGLHGTSTPETIGRSGSHGCIRLANWDAVRLANMLTNKITVTIE